MAWIAALFMGFVLGLLGGGGGILTVPILVGFFGFSAAEATGSSLFVVGIISIIGAAQGIIKKQTELTAAFLIAFPSMIGALLARKVLVPSIPETIGPFEKDQVLLGAFAILMIISGTRMLQKQSNEAKPNASKLLVVCYGFFIGLVSGTLGAGGGFLIIPVLTLFLGIKIDRAIPTSLLVTCIQSLVGFSGELGQHPIRWETLLKLAAVAFVGMGLGMTLRQKARKDILQKAFACMIFCIAAWLIVRIST